MARPVAVVGSGEAPNGVTARSGFGGWDAPFDDRLDGNGHSPSLVGQADSTAGGQLVERALERPRRQLAGDARGIVQRVSGNVPRRARLERS
jgi:hypothetical protein